MAKASPRKTRAQQLGKGEAKFTEYRFKDTRMYTQRTNDFGLYIIREKREKDAGVAKLLMVLLKDKVLPAVVCFLMRARA